MQKYYIASLLSLSIGLIRAQNIKINRYEESIKKYEVEKVETGQVVLYGSSSFALWDTYVKDLAPIKVINRGFGGSTAAEAVYYFDRVIVPLRPKVIFYYEGENDLAAGFTVDSTYSNYLKMTELVKKKLPGTKLVALSVKHSPSGKHIRDLQKAYNGMVRGKAYKNKDLGYVDITHLQFRPDGSIDPSMFKRDSLHVSNLAYKKWAIRMKEYLTGLNANTNQVNSWVSLFDEKTFNGWEKKGALATYEIKDGIIIGISDNKIKDNTFLCTQKLYKDFILELEVQADTMINSGIQFRTNSFPEYKNGRVHGYQMEIDPSERAWSGGLYDEARRGWLNKLEDKPYAQKAFNRYGWNKYRIEASGQLIKTYINGVLCTDFIDTLQPQSGFIALQVHGLWKKEDSLYTEKNGAIKVKWRNIRIQEK